MKMTRDQIRSVAKGLLETLDVNAAVMKVASLQGMPDGGLNCLCNILENTIVIATRNTIIALGLEFDDEAIADEALRILNSAIPNPGIEDAMRSINPNG